MAKGLRPSKHLPGGYEESTFKTIEFGFSPFVPFTETWNMILQGGKDGSDFKVHADSLDGRGEPSWHETIDAYGWDDVLKAVDNLPEGQINEASADMTEELANLLQGDNPIYSKYDTSEAAELEDLITIDWMLDSENHWAWEGDSWRTPGVQARRSVMGKQLQASSHENIDMMATTTKQADNMEYVLHRVGAHLGADFVKDIEGIEVTKMVGKKYTQFLFNELNTIEDWGDRWTAVANRLAEDFMEQYQSIMKVGGDLMKIAEMDLSKAFPGASDKVTAHGGKYDSVQYMALQMMDRFAEVSLRNDKSFATYMWQNPLTWKKAPKFYKGGGGQSTIIGFANFKAHLHREQNGAVTINYVSVDAKILDIGTLWKEAGFISKADYLKYLEAASSTGYGTLAQFLLWDRMQQVQQGKNMLVAGSEAVGLGLSKWANFRSQRGEMLGSSGRYQVDEIARGMVAAGSVEAVQVLSTSEIATGVKNQFEAFFNSEGVTKLFSDFYTKARQSAIDVTNSWQRTSVGNRALDDADNVWADELYDSGGITGSKIGLPWFFYSGEDPMGWSRFHIREMDRLLLANLRQDRMQMGVGTTPENNPSALGAGMNRADGQWRDDYTIGLFGQSARFRGAGENIMGKNTREALLGGDWYEKGQFPRWAVDGTIGGFRKSEKKGGAIKESNFFKKGGTGSVGQTIEALDWAKEMV